MRRCFVITFTSSLVVATVFLAIGWHYLPMAWNNPLPSSFMDFWGDLISAGLGVEQAVGYVQRDTDPAWWHPTLAIGGAAIFWSLASAIMLTALRALLRLAARSTARAR